jgi:putative membrane protein
MRRMNEPIPPDPRTDLASRRTGLAFQRTRMSADRTLMAVIRTSLSLITFGFGIDHLFSRLYQEGTITRPEAARNFGAALVLIGSAMLVMGILYHRIFLGAERKAMQAAGVSYGETGFPPSFPMITAVLLLLVGVVVSVSMIFGIGPFG